MRRGPNCELVAWRRSEEEEKVYEDFTRRLMQNSENEAGSSYRPHAA
jgi:hypothetical protein